MSTQTDEACLHSVDTESPEKTEETGAKDSILKEISVDDQSDHEETETPGLEDSSDSENLKLLCPSFIQLMLFSTDTFPLHLDFLFGPLS